MINSWSEAAELPDQVLVVDDDASVLRLLANQIRSMGFVVHAAENGQEALHLSVQEPRPALIVSDVNMPQMDGLDLLRRVKRLSSNTQVVMVSGQNDMAIVRECLREGAYDYLIKPFEFEELSNAIRRGLERYHLLEQNEAYRLNLERMVQAQTQELVQTRDLALITLAKLAESRDSGTGLHLDRMAAYSKCLASALRRGEYGPALDSNFIQQVHKSSPLHDIGKVGIPDAILLKPGPLTEDEMSTMQSHATIGGDTLKSVIETFKGHTFLLMAMEIAYSHHEKWDGSGYPNGISGEDIPLAARIVALADAYDAITSHRPYKPAYDHEEAIRRITRDRATHFDPDLVDAFQTCHSEFESIKQQLQNPHDEAPTSVE
ncbi:MAG: response regulator [Acidobacteriota bacterium]|nr:response regulator [Acidobacteriota bacterium]